MGRTWLVAGGAGFIGSTFVRRALALHADLAVVTVDALTYAGSRENLADVEREPRHTFVHAAIADRERLRGLFEEHRPEVVVNFAAETHVDRSIDGPEAFLRTNVGGAFELFEAARRHAAGFPGFRVLHVSTDEVYGSLGPTGAFREDTPLAPNSPYSASKASADLFARAYFHTFGLPVLVTRGSNTFGPRQLPEKLIPLVLTKALDGEPLPVYGDGAHVRDWLFVDDHADAILAVVARGRPGEVYNVGGGCERTTLDVVRAVCAALERARPRAAGRYVDLIRMVADRPGHDRRYALDCAKVRADTGWRATVGFEDGLARTAAWYLAHPEWCAARREHRRRIGLGSGAGGGA